MDIPDLYLKRNIEAFLKAVDENKPFELDAAEAARAVKVIVRLYADSGLNA
jgi:hypothetical protein